VILYQEQVMKIAIDVAGFTPAGSDAFRRAMGTYRSAREMDKLHAEFVEGCASSYRTGLGALDARAEAVAVLLGDQPGVDRGLMDHVVEDWRRDPTPIVLASYRGRLGHPMLFARSMFDSLDALRGDKAAWKLVDAHPDRVRTVPIERPYPFDVNTWEEYEALLRDAGSVDH